MKCMEKFDVDVLSVLICHVKVYTPGEMKVVWNTVPLNVLILELEALHLPSIYLYNFISLHLPFIPKIGKLH